jgi:hypothetical protein
MAVINLRLAEVPHALQHPSSLEAIGVARYAPLRGT